MFSSLPASKTDFRQANARLASAYLLASRCGSVKIRFNRVT